MNKREVRFVVDRDDLTDSYRYLIVLPNNKAITFMPKYDAEADDYRLKLAGRDDMSKMERSKAFSALARSLGMTKKELKSLMGFASSFKHWEEADEQ
ncbi:MAG: hypothetical protein QIT35_gp67 [Methanophagales virus PBV299]|uniref:Uncharacterized protein n=1 Tax=Methanophagales virus PBV299 TaxID=2987730 RepID=A0ABY6GNN6_9CAUD|nr:MAG: hypothetical protein QIT35_gp67 [Methanophagales virus PBV299]UYL64863.1 MAG: hypothetical protein OFDIEDLO_00067 [Methanophagales virus PBV299]